MMDIIRKNLEKDTGLVEFLKALAHPVRIGILRKLIDTGKCPCGCNPCKCGHNCRGANCKCGCKCGELVELFPMSQSTVSQHIKELKKAGVIEMTSRKGDYILNYTKINESLNLLLALFRMDYTHSISCEDNIDLHLSQQENNGRTYKAN